MAKRPQLPPPKTTSAIEPAAPPTLNIYQARRARGFISNLIAVLLQPGLFFRTFPTNTQWVIVAILVLVVAGVQTVRQPTAHTLTSADPLLPLIDPALSGGGDFGNGGGITVGPPGSFNGPPVSGDFGGGASAPVSSEAIRNTTTTALFAAGTILIAWLIQSVLFGLVPLLRGRSANLGRNLQVAVWASVPIGLLFLLRLIYYESGGAPESPGLTALIDGWSDFAVLSPFVQNIVYMLLSSLTLFWAWNIVLIYLGARYALNGRAWSAFLVTLMWVILAITIPVVTGNVTAPARDVAVIDPLMLPSDEMLLPDDGELLPPVSDDTTTPPMPESTLESDATPESTNESAGL